jgi:phosphoserine phosphatase
VELERDDRSRRDRLVPARFVGVPSAREGKVVRVAQWLQATWPGLGHVHTTFYSDSMNDLPLLEKSTVPVATNPDARLRAHGGSADGAYLTCLAEDVA